MGMIHEILPLVMEEVGAIGKDSEVNMGRGGKYSYRSIDQVLAALHPALIKHKICTSIGVDEITATAVQEVNAKNEPRTLSRTVCRVTVTFFATDGSSLQSSALGEGVDYSGDKASAKAVSMGTKYAIGHGLCIPYEDAADPDRDQPDKNKPIAASGFSLSNLLKPSDSESAAVQNQPASDSGLQAIANDPRADAIEVGLNEPCLPHQRAKIVELWIKTDRTKEQLKELVMKRGKTSLAELTVAEASEFIAGLAKKLGMADCPF